MELNNNNENDTSTTTTTTNMLVQEKASLPQLKGKNKDSFPGIY